MRRQCQKFKLAIAGLKFTWDDNKARANERKHGVTFEEAASCWLDPFNLESDDPEHSTDESRWLLIGTSKLNRLLICWFTVRQFNHEELIRIIGARKANSSEREQYEETPR
ncbi:MAG: BrnT family toxin [candidate division KSB1 bacterium]|nr:BrnT family toxin [candidate division KSB1 bacterium]MDZ7302369.1 BrnT family toxin [candidate division KSB1 bacterium]MDZ7313976.1 BrnT family toxin [candidate division KSB1 bacterium]